MQNIKAILYLRFLYYQKMLGVEYAENINLQPTQEALKRGDLKLSDTSLSDMIAHCTLCERSKRGSQPIFGLLPSKPKVIFITQLPLVDTLGVFLENKSAKMLQDIIKNVFALQAQEYALLSLVKCDGSYLKVSDEEMMICKQYVQEQIASQEAKIVILMGDSVLMHLLGLGFDTYSGRVFTQANKQFLATYSLGELLKNPSLKKEAMQHFLLAKGVL
ncbi:hypothetical protein BKH46_02075 [Helicobacter sp. 12S02634-8]|uniref:uracil-DNA glycosylase family protein n=1 Tax=Helicobacter sp. 12S02634-8 TaxID=1476199 RepID=UPI000BA77F17|nr:uracil-DNA glycosylase family protein [Helicobacter sp. 12S02634-8]PAF48120.1 hypothetical protein BKH46_02075 [Helicobacter sp. 12S02634-8]